MNLYALNNFEINPKKDLPQDVAKKIINLVMTEDEKYSYASKSGSTVDDEIIMSFFPIIKIKVEKTSVESDIIYVSKICNCMRDILKPLAKTDTFEKIT